MMNFIMEILIFILLLRKGVYPYEYMLAGKDLMNIIARQRSFL